MTVRTGSKFGDSFPFVLGTIETTEGNRIFIRRFPKEPLTAEFEPSAYNVNSSGAYPRYRANVVNRFEGFKDKDGYEASVYDVYVINGTYYDESIKLNRNDGEVVDIDMSPIVGWYIGE